MVFALVEEGRRGNVLVGEGRERRILVYLYERREWGMLVAVKVMGMGREKVFLGVGRGKVDVGEVFAEEGRRARLVVEEGKWRQILAYLYEVWERGKMRERGKILVVKVMGEERRGRLALMWREGQRMEGKLCLELVVGGRLWTVCLEVSD